MRFTTTDRQGASEPTLQETMDDHQTAKPVGPSEILSVGVANYFGLTEEDIERLNND